MMLRLFAQCQHPAYNGQNKTQKCRVSINVSLVNSWADGLLELAKFLRPPLMDGNKDLQPA